MYKKHLQSIAALFTAMFLLAAFTGCSGNAENRQTETTGQSAQSAGESTAAGTSTGTEAYVPTKALKISVWDTQGQDVLLGQPPKEDIPGKWLAEKTRVVIDEYFGNGGQQWDAKLVTLVASGNLPNVVLTWASQGPAHHAKLHEGKLNWELTPEILQKYAPHVLESIPQYAWDMIKIDGKIYGIPMGMPYDKEADPNAPAKLLDFYSAPFNKATANGINNGLYIRDDIVKKFFPDALDYNEALALAKKEQRNLGEEFLLPIQSTEEYIKFMYDIKALNLKEGNKPIYATGYTAGDNWNALSVLGAEMLGYKNYFYTGFWSVKENKMTFGYLDPVFRESAKIQTKMIRDKVTDPESLMHSAEKFTEKVNNGQYAIAWLDADVVNKSLESQGKPFRYIPFLTQVPQREDYPQYKEGPPSFTGALTFLTSLKEDELYQVLHFVDTLFTEEWDDIRWWGPPEAGLYDVLPDGKRQYKDPELQKYLVTGEPSQIKDNTEAKGLGGQGGFYWPVSKWINGANGETSFEPRYMYQIKNLTTINTVLKFSADSKWTNGFYLLPPVQSWSAPYANIPEVQKLWSTRAVWDDPFKVAFTAKNDEDFDKKWDAAIENFKKTIDVDKMLEEQTKIALPLIEQRKNQAK